MVNFKKLADRAKDVVEKQGGTDALKDRADRMKQAASGSGSVSDKAKAAAAAAREKPSPEEPAPATPGAQPAAEPFKQGATGEEPPAPQ